MFADFNRVFKPTPEQRQKQINKINEIIEEVINQPRPNLLPHKNGLLISEPFRPFYGDCAHCKYYDEHNLGFVEGGWCTLKNNIGCGWGFTCNEFINKIKYDFYEVLEYENCRTIHCLL